MVIVGGEGEALPLFIFPFSAFISDSYDLLNRDVNSHLFWLALKEGKFTVSDRSASNTPKAYKSYGQVKLPF